jgi:serine/threonine-protein kinase
MHEGLLSLVGKTVGGGRFRLDRNLDQGGMGAVFAGVELATGRPVAIKLMHPGLADEAKAMRRFQREAEVTTRLRHPHVVEVIAAGGGEGEPPFIAMELLEGASVSARLKQGETFDVARAIRIARQVLAAVAAGHRIGVVHRDLKPANVMLVGGGDSQIAKVVDYGVARLAMTDTMTRLTATGQVVGTPSYMSPEQAMGEPAGPDCDVYAVGAILHRLLVGEPPYGRGQYVDLLKRMVVNDRPRIHERVPGLGRLADVIERAIAHDPEARYQSAEEMNEALAALDARPKTTIMDWRPPADLASLRLPPAEGDATIPPTPQRIDVPSSVAAPTSSAPGPRTPSRLPVLVIAAVSAALVGGIVTWLWLTTDPGTPPPRAAAETGTPDLAVAPTSVLPVEVTTPDARVIDAGVDTSAPDAREARPVRRRRRVRVRYGGGDLGARATAIRQMMGGPVDLTPCWPANDPMPSHDWGTDFYIDIDAGGTPKSVRPGTRYYPEFNTCAMRRLRALSFGDGPIETVRITFQFYEPR